MAYGSEAFAKSLGFCIVSVDGVSDNRTSNLRSHGRKLGDIFPRGLSFPFRGGCVCIYIYEYSPVNQHSYGKWPSYRWFTYLKWWFSAFALNERWPQREGSLGYSHVGMDGRFSNNHWKAKLERQLRGPAARYPEQDLQMVNSCKLHIELLPSGKLR